MESLPWRFLVIALILTVTISIAFYEIEEFKAIRGRAEGHQGVERLINKMEMLKTSRDPGSFDRTELTLGENQEITVSNSTNSLRFNGKDYVLPTGLVIVKGVDLQGPRTYEIALYYKDTNYSNLDENLKNRDKTIVFK